MRFMVTIAICVVAAMLLAAPAAGDGVAVGEADYSACSGFADLPKDINDANDMAAILTVPTTVQTDQTLAQIGSDVRGVGGGVDNLRIVFVSSHGHDDPFSVVTTDCQYYTKEMLGGDLSASTDPVVGILDCCHAGGIAPQNLSCPYAWLCACASDECAHSLKAEPRDERNSLFTEWLLKAMRDCAADADGGNGNGRVTLDEIDSYLTRYYDPAGYHHKYFLSDPVMGQLVICPECAPSPVQTKSWAVIKSLYRTAAGD
jgi:hypothetical protein